VEERVSFHEPSALGIWSAMPPARPGCKCGKCGRERMNSYNGFSGEQRERALAWFKAEKRAGRRDDPVRCDACGQGLGLMQAHSEDYSEPFGDHIGRFGLCYACHMMIHCRFRNPAAWESYCYAVVDLGGMLQAPFHANDFQRFTTRMLANHKAQLYVPDFNKQHRTCNLRALARGEYFKSATPLGEPPCIVD